MAILRSSYKAGQTKPQAKSFRELVGRLGQRSQLAAPKYEDSTKRGIAQVWGLWTKFCQKVYDETDHFSTPDPVEVCKNHIHYEVVRSFLEWSCQNSKLTSSSSLFTYAKAWRMGVIQYTRSAVDPAIRMDMKNFIMDTLIDQFELKQTGRFRGVVNADDVLGILHHHWVLCNDYYPGERQRLQHAIMDIFCASTTARAGTVVESSCYFGRNEAVEYGDIELYIVRDNKFPGGVKLGMLVQLRLLKGRRNRGNPPKIKFTERRDAPSFCLIKAILGIAFRDMAFASKWIHDPQDIYSIDIPRRLESVPIEWAGKWKEVPLLRRSVRDSTGKVYTSPHLASQYNQMAMWNRRLGRSFGMKETFEFKMLRRGAAEVLQEGPRSQAMGHVNGTIHEKHYRNQIVDADIVSAFLETPSDEAIMKLMGHMSLTRDPNAPAGPTSAQRRQVQANVEVIAAKRQADISTKAIRDCYGSLAAAKRKAQEDPTVQIELDENTRLRKDHDSLSKRKLTSLFELSREEYFSTLGAACLENQHTGQEEPAAPSMPAFLFSEREALAKLLFPSPTLKPKSHQEQIEDSCQIIRLYASLCGRREYPRTRRGAQRDGQDQSEESGEVSEIMPCFLDTEPDIYPMQCPGTQCLFCLGDVSLAANVRTRCFANPFTLTRHVHKQHLQYLPAGQPFTCPHPSCSVDRFLLQDANHYKNHALIVHSVAHSA